MPFGPSTAPTFWNLFLMSTLPEFWQFFFDGNTVEKITAFLQSSGGHEDPKRLYSNAGQSFKGVEATGKGFIFDLYIF